MTTTSSNTRKRAFSATLNLLLLASPSSSFLISPSVRPLSLHRHDAIGDAARCDDGPISASTPNAAFTDAIVRGFGVVTVASMLFFNAPQDASAAAPYTPFPMDSSTIQIAETLKTMDFSMPSYDKISDSQTKVDAGDVGLVEEIVPPEKKIPAGKKEAAPAGEKQARAVKKPTIGLQPIPKAKKEAKPKAEKAAKAEKAPDEGSSKNKGQNFDFVDMGLPSYGDSAGTESKKGLFSL